MAEESSITSKDWLALGLGGASFLPMLFSGGGDNVDKALGDLKDSTDRLTKIGADDRRAGSDVLGPALKYLAGVTSGNRQDVLAATMPERRRIIDQYDTAKKNVAEFSPRGGGLAGSLSLLNASQASDLATTGGQARKEGVDSSLDLGTRLKQMGLASEGAANQGLSNILQTYLKQQEDSGASAASLGKGLATLIATVLL